MNFFAQLGDSWDKLSEKLASWFDTIVLQVPNIVLALVVMAIAIMLSSYVKRVSAKAGKRFFHDLTLVNIFANMITVIFMAVMLFITLSILGLDTVLTSLLAGAGVVGLAIGLALQEPLTNLFSGVMMSTRKYYNVGDLVETNSFFGKIKDINLRTTVVQNPTGQEIIIPNKMVIQNPLMNYTIPGERRVEVECGVSYGDDLRKVKDIVLQVIDRQEAKKPDRPVEFFYTGFGDSSINFKVRFWLKTTEQPNFLMTRSEVIMGIKEAFDANDITIPFPIRTLDFGIKGGERLNEVMDAEWIRQATSTPANGNGN